MTPGQEYGYDDHSAKEALSYVTTYCLRNSQAANAACGAQGGHGSTSDNNGKLPAINGWYDLFSRGSRDGCATVKKFARQCANILPQIIANGDMINHGTRTVRVPMKVLEHYQFRLRPNQKPAASARAGQAGRFAWQAQ